MYAAKLRHHALASKKSVQLVHSFFLGDTFSPHPPPLRARHSTFPFLAFIFLVKTPCISLHYPYHFAWLSLLLLQKLLPFFQLSQAFSLQPLGVSAKTLRISAKTPHLFLICWGTTSPDIVKPLLYNHFSISFLLWQIFSSKLCDAHARKASFTPPSVIILR